MSHNNWGIYSQRIIANGIHVLTGEGHGGVKIKKEAMESAPGLSLLRNFPGIEKFWEGDAYYFEEDSDVYLLHAVLGHADLLRFLPHCREVPFDQLQLNIAKALIFGQTEFFRYLSEQPESFLGNPAARQKAYQDITSPLYFIKVAYGAWAWDVPEGHSYFVVQNQNDPDDQRGFLVTSPEYKTLFKYRDQPVLIYDLKPFAPDENLPSHKPNQIEDDTYYMVNVEEDGGETTILAYNYSRRKHKTFRFASNALSHDQQFRFKFLDPDHQQLDPELAYYVQVQDVDPYAEAMPA